MNRILTVACVAILFATAAPARAQLIAYEGFNYPAGQSLDGQAGGTGFAPGTFWSVTSGTMRLQAGSLAAGTLATSGNSLTAPTDGSTSSVPTYPLATTFGTNGTNVWMSVVMKGLGTASTQSNGTTTLKNGTGGGFSIVTGTSSNAFYSVTDATTGATFASSTVNNAALALLVAHVQFQSGADVIDLYVNPPPGGAAPATPNAHLTTLDTGTSLDRLSVTGSTSIGSVIQMDEIRLGSTFASVTPVAVPEPSTLLLAAAAGVGLFVRRRNRTT